MKATKPSGGATGKMANWKIELREKDHELEKIVECIYELYPTAIKDEKKSTPPYRQSWTCGSFGQQEETYNLIDKEGNKTNMIYQKETKNCTCGKINDTSEKIVMANKKNKTLICAAEYMTWDGDHNRVKVAYQEYEKKICNQIPGLLETWLRKQFERGDK